MTVQALKIAYDQLVLHLPTGRYLLGMILNVASKEDDTDGQPRTKEGDTNNQKVSSKQIKQIE